MLGDPSLRYSTYSIVARDAKTGQFGVAVQTHQMCVGVAVPWLSPGIGAIATQAMSNVRYGPMGLSLMKEGIPADQVIKALVATDAGKHSRQLAIVDRKGRAAAWTGENCIPVADHRTGTGFSVQANMMLKPGVVEAMATAYETTEADFAGRLLGALQAAQEKGGDIRGMQSVALKIVQAEPHDDQGNSHVLPLYDLRVDEHPQPLEELARLVVLRRATLLSREGSMLLEQGKKKQALEMWQEARAMAPDQEELAFWQAVGLADEDGDFEIAVDILKPVLAKESNRNDWIDLIHRLEGCGVIENDGVADRLVEMLG